LRQIYINSLGVSESKRNLAIDIQLLILNHSNLTDNIREEITEVNTKDPIDILEKFSHSKDRALKKSAQARLRSIYLELASTPNTSIEKLWGMLYHRDIEIRLAVLLHPQGLNLFLDRALHLENSLNRFITGLHPQLSMVQRDKLLHSDNYLDRLAISCNPSTSVECLHRLNKDSHDLIRNIANNLDKC
jgi:hypothetical protein